MVIQVDKLRGLGVCINKGGKPGSSPLALAHLPRGLGTSAGLLEEQVSGLRAQLRELGGEQLVHLMGRHRFATWVAHHHGKVLGAIPAIQLRILWMLLVLSLGETDVSEFNGLQPARACGVF